MNRHATKRSMRRSSSLWMICLLATGSLMAMGATAKAALSVTSGTNGAALVNALVGPNVQTQNIVLTANAQAVGTFSGGTGIVGFEGGIVLSTGKAADVVGPNSIGGASTHFRGGVSTNFGGAGDGDLNDVAGDATFDAVVLEFDFYCDSISSISFQYVFGSEEYNEYVGRMNDAFAFFIDGTNVALLPGTDTPVTINTVNCGNPYNSGSSNAGCPYFLNNENGSKNTQMDGLTIVFVAAANITPSQWHHMKIAIADAYDGSYDSAVFIKGASLVCGSQPTEVPTVGTLGISSITSSSASGGGEVFSDGGASVTARGVCWSTSADPTTSDSATNDGTGTGTFTSSITGLTPGATYHVRAYATNAVGTSYGTDVQFTASTAAPTVTTAGVSSIRATSARCGGNVTADGGASVTARGVCWGTSANPTTSDNKTSDANGPGAFESAITGLSPGTTYHIRAYATNSVGTAYGSDATFTTRVGVPELVISTAPIDLTTTIVPVGHTVDFLTTVTNAGPIDATGVFLTLSIPPKTKFVSAGLGAAQSAFGAVVSQTEDSVTLAFGDIPAGESRQLSVTLRIMEAGEVRLDGQVASNETDTPTAIQNTAPLTTTDEYLKIVRAPSPLCGAGGCVPLLGILGLLGLMRRGRRNLD